MCLWRFTLSAIQRRRYVTRIIENAITINKRFKLNAYQDLKSLEPPTAAAAADWRHVQ